MIFTFYKYQGTGNDFVLIDNRKGTFKANTETIKSICTRRFGVGADGLILLENSADADFKMVYFNADGNQSTMCGNGGRCIVKFAQHRGIIQNNATFIAIDGVHHASINKDGTVRLGMIDTILPELKNKGVFVDTGSPHHVVLVENVQNVEIKTDGLHLRNSYGKAGANVNFVEVLGEGLSVRTYERGVEDETFSCGTGVTASAIVAHFNGWIEKQEIPIFTPGGELSVQFEATTSGYKNVWLSGPAQFVFQGEIDVPC